MTVPRVLITPGSDQTREAMFNHLVAKALDPDESKNLIAEVAADLA